MTSTTTTRDHLPTVAAPLAGHGFGIYHLTGEPFYSRPVRSGFRAEQSARFIATRGTVGAAIVRNEATGESWTITR